MSDVDFEVGIIGGGPAGAAAASYLAKAGLSCAVFESEVFPRPHVGESLVPATSRVLGEIGALDLIDKAGFPRKFGAAWTSPAHGPIDKQGFTNLVHDFRAADVLFGERDQEGVHQNYTYHVDRGKFDTLLLRHAHELGATVYQGTRVTDVDLSDATKPRISVRMGSQKVDMRVRVVLDASGRQTFLGGRRKLKVMDPTFNQYAIHTWFDDFDRGALTVSEEQRDYIFIHFLPITNTWVWQIPITDTITSVGVVTQKANFAKAAQEREEFFWDSVDSRPELGDALRAARQVRPFTSEGDYSYSMSQICGDGFALIGDAARFVDPIFSSGVSVAMSSARLAANAIIEASATGDYSKQAFATFEETLRRGMRNWYEFISLYYRLNILFTAFVQDPRYRIDVLKLLQGDLYDTAEPEVLVAMREHVSQVEQDPDHLWHKHLGTLRAPTMSPVF